MNPFDLTFIGIYSCSSFMRNLNTVDLRKYPHLIYDWLWSSNRLREATLLGIPMQF